MSAIVIDGSDPTPSYEQIRRQVVGLIESGALTAGEKLPTVRQLAGDLRLAPGTVSRAYKELEGGGYVETRRAAGTRVLAQERAVAPGEVARLARQYVRDARAFGADDRQVLSAVRDALLREPLSARET